MRRIALLGAATTLLILLFPRPGQALLRPAQAYNVNNTTGLWSGAPLTGTAKSLVIYGHGCCYTEKDGPTMRKLTSDIVTRMGTDHPDAVIIAPDYTGDGTWNVTPGISDALMMEQWAKQQYPTITKTIIWGSSMGGIVSGISTVRDPSDVTYWVDTYGVSDLTAFYNATGSLTKMWIANDMGGTPTDRPADYAALSIIGQESKLGSLARTYLFHGTADAVVPPAETQTVAEHLKALGYPVTWVTGEGAAHDGNGVWRMYEIAVGPLLSGQVPLAGGPAMHCPDYTTSTPLSPPPACAAF